MNTEINDPEQAVSQNGNSSRQCVTIVRNTSNVEFAFAVSYFRMKNSRIFIFFFLVTFFIAGCNKHDDNTRNVTMPHITATQLIDEKLWAELKGQYDKTLTTKQILEMASLGLPLYEEIGAISVEPDLTDLKSAMAKVEANIMGTELYTSFSGARLCIRRKMCIPLRADSMHVNNIS